MQPATASHRQLTPEQRAELGIGDGMVRMSCGIEETDDLVADVLQALAAIFPARSVAGSLTR